MAIEQTSNPELVIEVIDALLHPAHDGELHGQHETAIWDYLQGERQDAAAEELQLASAVFSRRTQMSRAEFYFDENSTAKEVAQLLKRRLPYWPYYLYHGTLASRVQSIAERGLQPAFARSVWKKHVGTKQLERGVFLTNSWRSATAWGIVHNTKRDGEQKNGDTVAVIRLLAHAVTAAPDPLAKIPHSLVAYEAIAVDDAWVLVGHFEGMPVWQPMANLLTLAHS